MIKLRLKRNKRPESLAPPPADYAIAYWLLAWMIVIGLILLLSACGAKSSTTRPADCLQKCVVNPAKACPMPTNPTKQALLLNLECVVNQWGKPCALKHNRCVRGL